MIDVGDVVYVCRPVMTGSHMLQGLVGIVRCIKPDPVALFHYGVEFDKSVGGHDCDQHCTPSRGWFLNKFDVIKMEPVTLILQRSLKDGLVSKVRKNKIPYYREPIIRID